LKSPGISEHILSVTIAFENATYSPIFQPIERCSPFVETHIFACSRVRDPRARVAAFEVTVDAFERVPVDLITVMIIVIQPNAPVYHDEQVCESGVTEMLRLIYIDNVINEALWRQSYRSGIPQQGKSGEQLRDVCRIAKTIK
jgi:hypothetical protein